MKSTFSRLQFCRWQYGSISIRLAVVVVQMYDITRKAAKFQENSNLLQFKVIQGHRPWCQSKAHVRLPISY